jgi:hypothetical protein
MTEGRMHYQTKELVANMIRRGPGYLIVSHEVGFHWESIRVDVSDMEVVVECAYPGAEEVTDPHFYCATHGRYPEMIFDVGLAQAGKVKVAIEVMRSNWIDAKKRAKILKSNVLVIGVCARSNDWEIDNIRLDAREVFIPQGCRLATHIMAGAACK